MFYIHMGGGGGMSYIRCQKLNAMQQTHLIIAYNVQFVWNTFSVDE